MVEQDLEFYEGVCLLAMNSVHNVLSQSVHNAGLGDDNQRSAHVFCHSPYTMLGELMRFSGQPICSVTVRT
jgi:hypothetical protein